MEKFDYKGKIQVYGAMFDGVNDIILHALKGISKDGVYVGEESQRYPCFDSEDYASESRYYWNFVFAKSKTELKDRMQKLKAMPVIGSNFKKLNNELHPMGYWGGDTNYPVEMTTEETKAFEKVTFKEIGKLDMVIAFDTTGSMAAYIEAVRSEVADLVPRLFKENDDLRLGIVAFGDYCDMKSAHEFGDAYQCMTLTNNENDLIKFIRETKNTSGGEGDEFHELVIKKIVEETPWRENSTRAILLISDADPHPLGYTYENYVVGNQIDWRKEAEKAARKKIKIDTVTITNAAWYKELSAMTNGISVPFETCNKTARLVEAATMARGSVMSRAKFDELADNCEDEEMRQVFCSYSKERNDI